MYNCMANSENTKLSMFIKICKNEKKIYIRYVCNNWGVSELQLWSKWKSENVFVFDNNNIEECEHVTEMIRELSCGINGFNMTEITDILAYISTN